MCDIYYINGQLTYFECTDYCERLFSDDDFVVTESVLDSIKNFFKSLKSKLKSLWEKLKSIFIKKDDKLKKIEEKAKTVDKNEKVTIPNLDKLEAETVKQKKNKNKKIDPKKVLIGIGTVTLTVTGAIFLIKNHRSKLQQKQNTKGKEVEETLDKTEKEINKKVEETLDKTKKDSKKKNELALIPGRNYDIGWKPMSSKEIKNSQEKVLIKKEKEYIGAHEVTIANKNLGSDEDIKKKVDRRLEELKKWEAEQKTKCTGLVIDEYSTLSSELSVIESTIDTLDQEIDQLRDAIVINKERMNNIGGRNNGVFYKHHDGTYGEPTINNKVYKYLFNLAYITEKINKNNAQELIKDIEKTYNDLVEQVDTLNQQDDISNLDPSIFNRVQSLITTVRIDLVNRKTDIKEDDLREIRNYMRGDIIITAQRLTHYDIFCTNSPYDWLDFTVYDSNTVNKKREAISQIQDARDRQKNTLRNFIKRKDDLTKKRDELKSKIDEGKKKKDAEQKAFNKTREKNLEDIKTVSGKGGYDALYNKIKDEVKKA